jgi:hypothetical protein
MPRKTMTEETQIDSSSAEAISARYKARPWKDKLAIQWASTVFFYRMGGRNKSLRKKVIIILAFIWFWIKLIPSVIVRDCIKLLKGYKVEENVEIRGIRVPRAFLPK